jgi:putative transcriptional regulator
MDAYILLRYDLMKNVLKVERAKHNITQADLAEKVRVSRQTINSIEIGKYCPSTLLALKIAAVFKTGVNDIFTLEDEDWN